MNYEWGISIALYLFIAGIAGGAYFVAVIAESFGNEKDKKVAEIGYYLAFPLAVLGGIVLTLDIGNPDRAWRLFNNFKIQSPMSIGSWSILIFGIFAFLSIAITLATKGKSGGALNPLKKAISWIGIVISVYLVLYTGVLLGTTSQALWTSTYLIGALFFTSGLSTGIAAIRLIAGKRGEIKDSLKKLERADKKAIIVEMIILLLFIIALYLYGEETRLALDKLTSGQNGLLFWGGVVVLGLVLPLLSLFKKERGIALTNFMMFFVLLGGFIMRYVLLIAGQI